MPATSAGLFAAAHRAFSARGDRRIVDTVSDADRLAALVMCDLRTQDLDHTNAFVAKADRHWRLTEISRQSMNVTATDSCVRDPQEQLVAPRLVDIAFDTGQRLANFSEYDGPRSSHDFIQYNGVASQKKLGDRDP